MTLLQAAVQDLVASELLQPAPNIRLFLVAKPDGSARLMLDLSPWTGFCSKENSTRPNSRTMHWPLHRRATTNSEHSQGQPPLYGSRNYQSPPPPSPSTATRLPGDTDCTFQAPYGSKCSSPSTSCCTQALRPQRNLSCSSPHLWAPPVHGPPQTSSGGTPCLPGYIRAQRAREVHPTSDTTEILHAPQWLNVDTTPCATVYFTWTQNHECGFYTLKRKTKQRPSQSGVANC
jgi:hypothetical protein